MRVYLHNDYYDSAENGLTPSSSHEFNLLAQREVWGLQAGDVLVTSTPLTRSFQDYAFGLLQVPADGIRVIAPQQIGPVEPLIDALRRENLLPALSELVRHAPDPVLDYYCLENEKDAAHMVSK